MVSEYDRNIIQDILEQCKIMEMELNEYHLTPEKLSDDGVLFNACCHTIFQIGELANLLSDDFKNSHTTEDWNEMYKMRNIIGHHYGNINIKLLWQTATKDVPKLYKTCKSILDNLSIKANTEDCNMQILPECQAKAKLVYRNKDGERGKGFSR